RVADPGNDHGGEPLAVAPADAGEVVERRAASEDDRVDLLLAHDLLRPLDAAAALVGRDWLRAAAHRRQRRDARWRRARRQLAAARALPGEPPRVPPPCGRPRAQRRADPCADPFMPPTATGTNVAKALVLLRI